MSILTLFHNTSLEQLTKKQQSIFNNFCKNHSKSFSSNSNLSSSNNNNKLPTISTTPFKKCKPTILITKKASYRRLLQLSPRQKTLTTPTATATTSKKQKQHKIATAATVSAAEATKTTTSKLQHY